MATRDVIFADEARAGASALAVTAAAGASTRTNGAEAGVSVGPHDVTMTGD